ncbi:MAG: phosphoribosylaminoimidazolesuccinocarboxamide synthase [Elusimicrobia bacterium]|nr:phosphoribosylaminoimidazolesuccinocarboxamide synthase [Elusimicrobiota bacterium]
MNNGLEKEKIDLTLYHKGKVRDVYNLEDNLLLVASDRISAFDYVLPSIIPDKGKILSKLSLFWFNLVEDIVPNHLITGNFNAFPKNLKKYPYLKDRSMIVKKANRINIECIVRGYLAGSGWKEYSKTQSICGIMLLGGLQESAKLPEPIFTPSTKEEGGNHDQNISFEKMVEIVGSDTAIKIRDFSLALYNKVSDYAEERGIILADTKLEFGLLNGQIILIDEIFTPDSSRFWEKSKYQPGKSQDSLDKQYVRDYLESIKWNKQPPVPSLPNEVIEKTRAKYIEAYEKLTGKKF